MRAGRETADSVSRAPVWRLREKCGKKAPQTTSAEPVALAEQVAGHEVLEGQGVDSARVEQLRGAAPPSR